MNRRELIESTICILIFVACLIWWIVALATGNESARFAIGIAWGALIWLWLTRITSLERQVKVLNRAVAAGIIITVETELRGAEDDRG